MGKPKSSIDIGEITIERLITESRTLNDWSNRIMSELLTADLENSGVADDSLERMISCLLMSQQNLKTVARVLAFFFPTS